MDGQPFELLAKYRIRKVNFTMVNIASNLLRQMKDNWNFVEELIFYWSKLDELDELSFEFCQHTLLRLELDGCSFGSLREAPFKQVVNLEELRMDNCSHI
jgi:hypothetical protein